MNNLLDVRPADDKDVGAIRHIADQTELFPPEMLDDMMHDYLHQKSRDIWFVGSLRGEIIAFGYCEPERMTSGTWNLLAIGVLPSRQGQDFGAQMMNYLESLLTASGERVLLVETMGTPELAATREFYSKVGYEEHARVREFYEAGADKVIFWKHL